MPEDSKKNQKGKHEAKEQRKPRQSRQAADKSVKVENKTEEQKGLTQSKPVHVDPGPEFYKGLKRETDEILKITEEANAKYKKKEIQSNWSKYEMPIDSYDEIEEQENLGADYEKLITAPISIGGHFQFKHEKSWDVNTGPSLYDKYFEIDMENLATAISTVPFYERNSIDKYIFNETDMLSMNNRAVRYKRKYYNDKSFKTSELEAEDNILKHILEAPCQEEDNVENNEQTYATIDERKEDDINLDFKDNFVTTELEKQSSEDNESVEEKQNLETRNQESQLESEKPDIVEINNLLSGTMISASIPTTAPKPVENKAPKAVPEAKNAAAKESIVETPEDLEKWLDDFLDG